MTVACIGFEKHLVNHTHAVSVLGLGLAGAGIGLAIEGGDAYSIVSATTDAVIIGTLITGMGFGTTARFLNGRLHCHKPAKSSGWYAGHNPKLKVYVADSITTHHHMTDKHGNTRNVIVITHVLGIAEVRNG